MIVVIDYGMGNLHSVAKALEFVTSEKVLISRNKEDLENADKIVLPGVGSFGDAMKNIYSYGLDQILHREIIIKKKPLLGICLGLQILAEEGFENGYCRGLGFIHGTVKKFSLDTTEFKIPHVGWNNIIITKKNPFLSEKNNFYFVHSYYLDCPENIIIAKCNYGSDFVAAIQKRNILATQFHPEKSQRMGLNLLNNFVQWNGSD